MNFGEALLLGIVQGLTEFLPISSSGHLVLGQTLLGIDQQDIFFEVMVHFGTLVAVVVAFRNDVLALLTAFMGAIRHPRQWTKMSEDKNLAMIFYIMLATIPAVVVGLLLKDSIESIFSDPVLVCFMLLVTGFFLLTTLFVKPGSKALGTRNTLIMGCAQALAILPGISRSGSTISAGLLHKVSGDEAARFSFLLAIPAILGATLLEIGDVLHNGLTIYDLGVIAAGTLAAFLSGFIAIKSLLHIVRKGKLYWFAPYCFGIGILGLLMLW